MMKSKALPSLLLLLLTFLSFFSTLYSKSSEETHLSPFSQEPPLSENTQPEASLIPFDTGPGYTINFQNVSILEYIKFISKIANINFIYNETEMNFNVTVVSEESTSLVNVISALVQILKINGFNVIEQGNNLVISKSGAISQIATVVSQEAPLEKGPIPPIMTRVFKIKNANPSNVGQLISPLLSQDAILEVSAETRHIIITDITQNIEQIQTLLLSIDAAKSSLSIDSYTTHNNTPQDLISLANQLILPISEGNPIIFVPQNQTNTIFIVSTPYLIEKSIMIFEDLDHPPSLKQKFIGPITGSNILIYHIQNKPADQLQSAIKQIETGVNSFGPASQNLVSTLNTMRYIRESHSLLFTGAPNALNEVQIILKDLDIPYSEKELEFIKGGFYIYQIKNGDEEQITSSLDKLVKQLKKSPYANKPLIETIESMKWIKENNSLMFTGDQHSINRIKEILPTFDLPIHQGKTASKLPLSNDFYVYTPKHLSGETLLKQVKDVEKSLKTGNLADPAFLNTLNSVEWIPSSYSLVFTGDPQSLDRLHALLNTIDQPKGPIKEETTFYVYPLQHVKGSLVLKELDQIADSLKSNNVDELHLINSIHNITWNKETNALILTGTSKTIEKLKVMIAHYDIAGPKAQITSQFYVYHPLKINAAKYLEHLKAASEELKKNGLADAALIHSIQTAHLTPDKTGVLFTGTPNAISKVRELTPTFDTTGPQVQETSQFYVYHPLKINAAKYLEHLKAASEELKKNGLADTALIHSIQTAHLTPDKTGVLFTGTPDAISKVRELTPTFDTTGPKIQEISQFYVYHPLKMSAAKYLEHLKAASEELKKNGLADTELLQSLHTAHLTPDKTSVLFTGTPNAIAKVRELTPTFDTAGHQTQLTSQFYVYHPLKMSAAKYLEHLKAASEELKKNGLADTELLQSLYTAHLTPDKTGVLFTGTPEAISKVRELTPTFDSTEEATDFYVYKPKVMTPAEIQKRSIEMAKKLNDSKLNDLSLIDALNSVKISPSGDSVTYVGTPNALDQLKTLIPTYDIGIQKETQFFIYHPSHMTAKEFLTYIFNLQKQLTSSGLSDNDLIETLKKAQITSNGTAVLFTGTSSSIEEVKKIIEQYELHHKTAKQTTEFFVYIPHHMSAEVLRRNILSFADNMEHASHTDSLFIKTLRNVKVVSNGTSVLFTGTTASIEHIKELLPSIDRQEGPPPTPVKKTTFIVYKIKNVQGPTLMKYLKDMATDLQRSGDNSELGLIKTLHNARYIQETNSIIFTGTTQDLSEAQSLAVKFDISELNTKIKETPVVITPVTDYLIYNPKHLPGQQLISILHDFEQNLVSSGIHEPTLFNVIKNLKWMPQVSSILISGDKKDTEHVYTLLERFDLPTGGPATEPGIEKISNMSFLIYKLQYHSGAAIESALKKIGTDLANIKTDKTNQNLIDAIQSIQWIEVTNSLMSTGPPETLERLKELMKSIDIPLKQVFVEILVIDTTIANALNFGLRWGSQGVYRDKLAYGTSSSTRTGKSDPFKGFTEDLSQTVNASTTPTGSMIPFSSAFDLGVIGDIILHKGKSYFALGSLIDAIRTDTDTTISINQKLITQDNKLATIFVGKNVPYTGSIVSNTGGGTQTTTNANIEYRDVGVSFSITPQIGENNTITLNINEEITQQISADPTGSPTETLYGITTSKTTAQTSITVPDQAFLIIGGQIDNSQINTRTSIPCLGGLPLIGAAFTQNDTTINKSSVIIFVRPHIVQSYDTYKEITARQEDLARENTPDTELFDTQLELVKTPDDY